MGRVVDTYRMDPSSALKMKCIDELRGFLRAKFEYLWRRLT